MTKTKLATIEKLDNAAESLVKALMSDYQSGGWTKTDLETDVARVKNPTKIEVVKMTVRKDLKRIRPHLLAETGVDIANVSKSDWQINMLGLFMVERIKSRPEFAKIVFGR